jgi:FtsZ-interacting cell division protein ZipA
MPELRWTLLIIGALFIVGLALWEIRRQRHAPRPRLDSGASSDRVAPTLDAADSARIHREPTISLPELHPEPRAEATPTARTREPPHPPVVEVDSASFARLQQDATSDPAPTRANDRVSPTAAPGSWGAPQSAPKSAALAPATTAAPNGGASSIGWGTPQSAQNSAASSGGVAGTSSIGWGTSQSAQNSAASPGGTAGTSSGGWSTSQSAQNSAASSGGTAGTSSIGWGTSQSVQRSAAPAGASSSPPDAAASGATEHTLDDDEPTIETMRLTVSASSTGFVSDTDHPDYHSDPTPPEPAAAATLNDTRHPTGATADGAPIVEWPREETRKIVALRLVSAPAARFPGRAVRQALAAEGFVLGKFDIFHKAGPDERAILSAASLTKPGTFAMSTIDAQRFGGISLFAVLPGPLPPQQTFDELLNAARNLNDRLQGALQDERGEPLTPTRSASIRQSLSDGKESGSIGAGADPHSGTRQ